MHSHSVHREYVYEPHTDPGYPGVSRYFIAYDVASDTWSGGPPGGGFATYARVR